MVNCDFSLPRRIRQSESPVCATLKNSDRFEHTFWRLLVTHHRKNRIMALRSELKTYNQKRDFKQTSEPKGAKRAKASRVKAAAEPLQFVIQMHHASHLHWDFRLELDGVLKSWAVPKEPTMDPSIKRLAVQVEDHPLDYASFEGDIPKGNYGAGHVDIWDAGIWTCIADPRKSLERGKLTFELRGRRLRGRFTLVKSFGKYGKPGRNWLLIKANDDAAVHGDTAPVTKKKKPRGPSVTVKNQSRAGLIELTHPDRVLFKSQGITKQELADYYQSVSKFALPHIEARPLTLVRCPSGAGRCFYQKHAESDFGPGLTTLSIREKEKFGEYLQLESKTGFRSLVQHGALELHTWGSRTEELERPDQLVFDFDPNTDRPWTETIRDIQNLRKLIEAAGFVPFLKLSGNKGAHVHVPILQNATWDQAHEFAQNVAKVLEASEPKRYTSSSLKKDRKGKVFLDYLRNTRGASFVAPYSTRAKSNAPVAAPIEWDELSPKIKPDHFTVREMEKRITKLKSDPWKAFFNKKSRVSILGIRNLD